MSLYEFELNVGDVVQVGDYTVTVMDLENGEVTFQIQEPAADEDPGESVPPRPR